MLAFVLFGSVHLQAETPDDAEKAIIELHKSGKLFDMTRYKTIRAAFADLFEKKHEAEIRQAYGTDPAAFTAWLDTHADIKQIFYTALKESFDKLPAALSLFKDTWKKSPEQLEKYPNLAIAVAVTWDDARSLYDDRNQQVRTKSLLPDQMVDALGNFGYIIAHDKIMQGRLRYLPWEFLVFIVDHRTPLDERDWARQSIARPRAGTLSSSGRARRDRQAPGRLGDARLSLAEPTTGTRCQGPRRLPRPIPSIHDVDVRQLSRFRGPTGGRFVDGAAGRQRKNPSVRIGGRPVREERSSRPRQRGPLENRRYVVRSGEVADGGQGVDGRCPQIPQRKTIRPTNDEKAPRSGRSLPGGAAQLG